MKTQKENHSNHLKAMYEQVKDVKQGLLFAGLTVLVKDTADFINAEGFNDDATEGFRRGYLDMLNYDRYYWGKFGPKLFLTLPDAGLPHGIAKAASQCTFNLAPLSKPAIEQEWTRAPGWHFFKTYTGQIKADILGDKSLDELKAEFCNAEDPFEPVAALVETLAKRSRFGPAFWYPAILYIPLLLLKTDFRTLS
jgi:hypothetical protein